MLRPVVLLDDSERAAIKGLRLGVLGFDLQEQAEPVHKPDGRCGNSRCIGVLRNSSGVWR